MTASQDIDDLISRVALRDRAAFRELYERSSAKLFGICLRILRERQEAEEALQESFIKIWQGAGTFRSDKAAGMTWLCAVTRNRAIDRLRRHARTPLPIEEAAEVPDDAPSPEDAAAARGDLRRFNECLGTLAPSHAEAVRAAYLKGWTYREASEAMAVPVNTVKTWVRRGLITLRECMNR